MEEEWKEVREIPGIEVSNKGFLRRRKADGSIRYLNYGKNTKKGYVIVNFYAQPVKYRMMHRMVVEAFIRPIKPLEEVNHLNGIKHDNRLENLEITSHSGNLKYAFLQYQKRRKS